MVALPDAILVYCAGLVPPVTPTYRDAVVQDSAVVFWNTARLGPQPTADQLAAVTAQQVASYYTAQLRSAADVLLADPGAANKALRAVLLLAVDQLNMLREWCMSLQTGTASVATLAAFKTMVATLPALPDITISAAKAAVQSKIDSGSAD